MEMVNADLPTLIKSIYELIGVIEVKIIEKARATHDKLSRLNVHHEELIRMIRFETREYSYMCPYSEKTLMRAVHITGDVPMQQSRLDEWIFDKSKRHLFQCKRDYVTKCCKVGICLTHRSRRFPSSKCEFCDADLGENPEDNLQHAGNFDNRFHENGTHPSCAYASKGAAPCTLNCVVFLPCCGTGICTFHFEQQLCKQIDKFENGIGSVYLKIREKCKECGLYNYPFGKNGYPLKCPICSKEFEFADSCTGISNCDSTCKSCKKKCKSCKMKFPQDNLSKSQLVICEHFYKIQKKDPWKHEAEWKQAKFYADQPEEQMAEGEQPEEQMAEGEQPEEQMAGGEQPEEQMKSKHTEGDKEITRKELGFVSVFFDFENKDVKNLLLAFNNKVSKLQNKHDQAIEKIKSLESDFPLIFDSAL